MRDRVTEGDLKDSGNNNVRTYGYSYDAANNVTAKTHTVKSPYSSSLWTHATATPQEKLSPISMPEGAAQTFPA